MEDVHAQQISEFEVLKKFTHALAVGKDDVIEAARTSQEVSSAISKKSWVEE